MMTTLSTSTKPTRPLFGMATTTSRTSTSSLPGPAAALPGSRLMNRRVRGAGLARGASRLRQAAPALAAGRFQRPRFCHWPGPQSCVPRVESADSGGGGQARPQLGRPPPALRSGLVKPPPPTPPRPLSGPLQRLHRGTAPPAPAEIDRASARLPRPLPLQQGASVGRRPLRPPPCPGAYLLPPSGPSDSRRCRTGSPKPFCGASAPRGRSGSRCCRRCRPPSCLRCRRPTLCPAPGALSGTQAGVNDVHECRLVRQSRGASECAALPVLRAIRPQPRLFAAQEI